MKHDVQGVGASLAILGDFRFACPYGSGHINDTYAVVYDQGGTEVRYIFQRINHTIFRDPPALMENIQRVTERQAEALRGVEDASRRALTVIPTRDGQPFCRDGQGNYWRAYIFIEKAATYDVVESPDQARAAARAFGEFQQLLVGLPGPRLHETIPAFHDTPKRFQTFRNAVQADPCGRVAAAGPEIEFVASREVDTRHLLELHRQGAMPERVTHNDTKLNNVMIDDETGEGVCVIDLDTVMPGLALYDFGDLVRTSTSPAAEDETDLSKVGMQMPMFEALVDGYLAGAGEFLTPAELDNLPFSGKLITLEVGMRFLTDYLSGDVYFKTHRDGHNLDRCRAQLRLVESIEAQEAQMLAFVRNHPRYRGS